MTATTIHGARSQETNAEFKARLRAFWEREAALNREAGDEPLALTCDANAASYDTPYGDGAVDWEAP